MKRISKIAFIIALLFSIVLMDACRSRARDCRGRKKTVKTSMGGWL